jgi:hypothetical protein
MPALMFVPQPAPKFVFDILVDESEVPSGIEPGEVGAPPAKNRVEPCSLLAQSDPRFPPDQRSDFVPNTLHRAARGPAVTELPATWRLLFTAVHAEKSNPCLQARCASCLR